MDRRRLLCIALFALCASLSIFAQKRCPALEATFPDSKFAPGQVWSYRTRPQDPDSTLTILQIDRSPRVGIIVHVRVDGLQAHNPNGELVPMIEHMPFARDTMLLSVSKLLRTTSSLPTMEGYERWRADCGGVYTISVADAISVMEKTLNQP